jgi:hypothetical protein
MLLSLLILVWLWFWHAPILLHRLKCESKVKTMEEQGVKAHSLACNTLGVEGHAGTL